MKLLKIISIAVIVTLCICFLLYVVIRLVSNKSVNEQAPETPETPLSVTKYTPDPSCKKTREMNTGTFSTVKEECPDGRIINTTYNNDSMLVFTSRVQTV